MIVCITGHFPVYDRSGRPIPGEKEFGVSHGIDFHTGENVIMSGGTPESNGAIWHPALQEWVILDKDEEL